jgi:hypothetical protein
VTAEQVAVPLEWLLDDDETSLENSALLCERHHRKVQHGFGWNDNPTADGHLPTRRHRDPHPRSALT